MAGVNKVILIGNVGGDVVVKSFPSGDNFANISIATSEQWRDRNNGDIHESTEWHRVLLQKGLADIAQKYVKKGSKVYIEGKLRTRKYTDQNGIERYTTEIIASTMQMLDTKNSQQPQQGGYQQPQQGGYQQPQQQYNNIQSAPVMPDLDPPLISDDTIPF